MRNIDLHAQNNICYNAAHPSQNHSAAISQLRTLWQWMRQASQVHFQRRRLARLSPRTLSDIGISRDEALREAARPFWDFPESR